MNKIIRDWLPVILGLLILILASMGIRIFNLTRIAVFADEAIYIRWSQIMGNEPTLRFLPLSDGKQPLFMWILMFLVNRAADPLWMGRFLSVISGLGSILGVFVLIYILFRDKKAGVVGATIWALNPISFFFDRMALVDSLLTMLTVWTFIFAVLTAKYRRFDLAMITGFFLGLCALTKSPAIFTALILPSVFLVGIFPKRKNRIEFILVSISYLLIMWGIAFGMYNILRLGPNFHLLSDRTQDYVYPISHIWERPLDPFKPYMDRAFRWIWQMGIGTVYVLIGLSLLQLKRFKKEIGLLIIWFLIPLSIQAMFAKTFTVRYILFTLPFLFSLASLGIIVFNYKLRTIYLGFLVFYIIFALKFNYVLATDPVNANLPRSERSGYFEEWSAGTGIWEAANFIKKESLNNPDKKYVIGTEGYFGTLPDGLQMYMQGVPNVTVIGIGRNIGEIPVELRESKMAGNETFLVANSSRMNPEFDFGKVLVELKIEKAHRATDSHEYSDYGLFDWFYLLKVL